MGVKGKMECDSDAMASEVLRIINALRFNWDGLECNVSWNPQKSGCMIECEDYRKARLFIKGEQLVVELKDADIWDYPVIYDLHELDTPECVAYYPTSYPYRKTFKIGLQTRNKDSPRDLYVDVPKGLHTSEAWDLVLTNLVEVPKLMDLGNRTGEERQCLEPDLVCAPNVAQKQVWIR